MLSSIWGICGLFRRGPEGDQTQYCVNAPGLDAGGTSLPARCFFHNGVYHSLDDVMAFYNDRNTAPQKFYPRGADGKIQKYDDLPVQFHANIDDKDAPFDRKFGDKPAMTDRVIPAIGTSYRVPMTLNDGYQVSAH